MEGRAERIEYEVAWAHNAQVYGLAHTGGRLRS